MKRNRNYQIAEKIIRRGGDILNIVLALLIGLPSLKALYTTGDKDLKMATIITLGYLIYLTVPFISIIAFPVAKVKLHDLKIDKWQKEPRKYVLNTYSKQFRINIDVNYEECETTINKGMERIIDDHYTNRLLYYLFIIFLRIFEIASLYIAADIRVGANAIFVLFLVIAVSALILWEGSVNLDEDRLYVCQIFLCDYSRVKLYNFQVFERTLSEIKGEIVYDGEYLYYEEKGEHKRLVVPVQCSDCELDADVLSINTEIQKGDHNNKNIIDFIARGNLYKLEENV